MWFLFRCHVVILTPAYMLALKRPHILWSIGRSVDRGVAIIPAIVSTIRFYETLTVSLSVYVMPS